MPISFNCPSCKAGLSVKEEFAGKNANCPQCGNAFTVPNPDASSGGAPGGFSINTGGSKPGGGININTGGGGPAPSPAPAPAPAPSSGPAPGPAVGPAASRSKPGAIPQPGPGPAPASQPYASPGMDVRSDAGASGEPSRRNYPALNLAMQIYTILSILVLALGGIGVVVYCVVMILARQVLLALLVGAMGSLYVFMLWISLKAAAEFIKLFLNVEHDTHRIASGIRVLNSKMGD